MALGIETEGDQDTSPGGGARRAAPLGDLRERGPGDTAAPAKLPQRDPLRDGEVPDTIWMLGHAPDLAVMARAAREHRDRPPKAGRAFAAMLDHCVVHVGRTKPTNSFHTNR